MDSGERVGQVLIMEPADETDFTEESVTRREQHRRSRLWTVCGQRFPRCEIVFFCQIILIYIVVLTSLVNLALKNGPINLWIALLGSCLGYLLPHPSMDNLTVLKK